MSQIQDKRMELALPSTMSVVRDSLANVEQMLAEQLSSDVPIIDEMVRCGGATGGKRFRPVLLLLVAHANGGIKHRHIQLATSVEMIHAATLVHDDIIDDAEQRRHVSTINSRWGNQGAVLFGDYLFTQAFYLASMTGSAQACQIIGRATNRVCEGELQQSDATGNYETTIDEYYQIISGKTASLCACATRLGACLDSDDPVLIEGWHSVGENLGMAFQIIDDVLDFNGDSDSCGKTLGTDLETAKPTLPILLALQSCDETSKAGWIKKLTEVTVNREQVANWLRESGAIEQSIARARKMIDDALKFTRSQEASVAAAFDELGQFLLARTH